MFKTLQSSVQKRIAQPQANDIELEVFASAASPQGGDISKALANKNRRAENEAATISKLVAGLPPDTMSAMASVSHAWRDGVLNSSRWQAYAEIAAQLPPEKTNRRAPPPTQELIRKQTKRIGLMACVVAIGAAVAVGTGFGLATGSHLAAANRHACDAYAALPVLVFKYSQGSSYYLSGSNAEFVGNYTVDAKAACESIAHAGFYGASFKSTPYPAGFDRGRYTIDPAYIGPIAHHSFNLSQYAMVIGASLGTLMLFGGAGVALRTANRARMNRQIRDLEAGPGAEENLVPEVFDVRGMTPGKVVARRAKLIALEPMLREAIVSGRLHVIKQFGSLFKRIDDLEGRKTHQQLFVSAVGKNRSSIVKAFLAQGAVFDTSQLSRVIASGGGATLIALLNSPVAAGAVSGLHATALLDVVGKFSTKVVESFLNAAGPDKEKFLSGQSRHDRRTALHYAAHRGAPDLFALLYDHGADLDARDYQNLSPRQVANYRIELLPIVYGIRQPRFVEAGSREETEALLPQD
jgi:hypothetical protein